MFLEAAAPAKINLFLKVGEKRDNGYHDIESIMQSISLYDRLFFHERADENIEVSCDNPGVPCDASNLAYKAAALLKSRFGVKDGITIEIEKHVPVAAGLAGGSADAAAVLLSLNRLWNLGLGLYELVELGRRLGSDIPFCLVGGTALAAGLGERVFPLRQQADFFLVLAKPDFGLPTPQIYDAFDKCGWPKGNSQKAVQMSLALDTGNTQAVALNTYNDLEEAALRVCPELGRIRETMMKTPLIGVTMSGSGPTYFGLCGDEQTANSALSFLGRELSDCFLTLAKPIQHGIVIREEGKNRWKP